ncbi:MAG: hypothetical protein E2P06_06950 [Acidobacteria bacterium]|nr:MAG: hypothetical protein E2P06_06950 [Acidobacteriota bacterium]
MEYLEGETLAARLTKGPLPTAQVLKIAAEIADALDKAHRQGITHRDLKPGNIMLTKAGAKTPPGRKLVRGTPAPRPYAVRPQSAPAVNPPRAARRVAHP